MSVTMPIAKANDSQKFRVAQFCVKNNLITKDAIKARFEPVRYMCNVDGIKVSFSYSDVFYIVMGLTGTQPVDVPMEDIPEA